MEIPMKCLTSPNNREQGLSVIEFDKKSNLISLVFVKLFKTQNELLSEQDTNTFPFINKHLSLCWNHNPSWSLCQQKNKQTYQRTYQHNANKL